MTDIQDSPRPCPICGRPAVVAFRPFCSGRCADRDLGRWLSGVYRVAVDDPESDDEDLPPEADPGGAAAAGAGRRKNS